MFHNLPFAHDVHCVLFNRTGRGTADNIRAELKANFPAHYTKDMGTFPAALDTMISTMPGSTVPALSDDGDVNPAMVELMLDGVALEDRELCHDAAVDALLDTWESAQTAYGWYNAAYDRVYAEKMVTKGDHFSNLVQLRLACVFGLRKDVCTFYRWSEGAEEKLAYLLNRLMSEAVI